MLICDLFFRATKEASGFSLFLHKTVIHIITIYYYLLLLIITIITTIQFCGVLQEFVGFCKNCQVWLGGRPGPPARPGGPMAQHSNLASSPAAWHGGAAGPGGLHRVMGGPQGFILGSR